MPKKIKGRVAEVGRAFAKALSLEMAQAGTISYRAVATRLRRIERVHLQQLSGHKFWARELNRRTAEALLQQAALHGCSLKACRSRLNALSALGFTDIRSKAHSYLLYARYALSTGHRRAADTIAMAMVYELERSLRSARNRREQIQLRGLMELFSKLQHEIDSPPKRMLSGGKI